MSLLRAFRLQVRLRIRTESYLWRISHGQTQPSGSGGADLSFPVAAHPLPGFHRPIMRAATSGDRRGPFKTAPVKLARPVCKTVPASGKLRGKPRWSHADQQDRPGGPGTGERAEIS